MAITFWRNVQRKITTQEMDASFDTLVADIANAGLSAEMPEGQIYIGDNTNTASLETLDKTLVGLNNVDNTSDANKPVSIAGMASNSTGVKTGGVVSIGTGGAGVATTFTIASGVGVVVDNTTIPATLINVSWSAKTDVAVTNIGTQPITFVAIDSAGNAIQQATDFDGLEHRQYMVIGSVIHTNLTTVTAVNQGQHLAISPQAQLNDLFQSLAGFNITGNIFSANGTNLNINKSAGEIFKQGANYSTSANNPNIVITGSLTAGTFRYNNQTGSASGILSAIDPNNYDLAGVTTAVSVNKFTIQRIFLFSSNLLAIQRGQHEYNSLAEAKASIQTETFIVNSSIIPNGVLRAYLIVQQGATALNSATKAFFLEAPKFGGTAGVGGLSVSTLQNAYDNSISPEILTDATRGAVSIKRGSSADTDLVIEVLNGAGTVTSSIDGNGLNAMTNASVSSATVSTPTFFDTAKKLITTTAQLWGTWVQTWGPKATPVDADTIGFHDSASTFVGVKSTLLNLWTTYFKVKADLLYLKSAGLTANYLPYFNGTNLVNSTLQRGADFIATTTQVIAGKTLSGGNTSYNGRYNQNLHPDLYGVDTMQAAILNSTVKGLHLYNAGLFMPYIQTSGWLNRTTGVQKYHDGQDFGGGNNPSWNYSGPYPAGVYHAYVSLSNLTDTSEAYITVNDIGNVTNIDVIKPSSNITFSIVSNKVNIAATGIVAIFKYIGESKTNSQLINQTYSSTGLAKYWTGSEGFGVGHSSQNASAIFQVESTAKGSIPYPRMTNLQRTNLTVNATTYGLIVYCTDATEGLYIYKSTGWTFII